MISSSLFTKNSNFRAFWVAYFFQYVSTGIFFVTMLSVVMEGSSSLMTISSAISLQILPSILLAPLSGVILDRFGKSLLRNVCNLGRMSVSFTLAGLYTTGHLSLPLFLLATITYYTFFYLQLPIEDSITRDLLNQETYTSGTSLLQVACQFGALISGVSAGVLLKYLGVSVTMAAAGSAELLSFYLFTRFVHLPRTSAVSSVIGKSGVRKFFSDIQEGWTYIFSDRRLLLLSLAATAVLPFVMSINTLMAPLAYHVLQGGQLELGTLESLWGVGTLLSGILCAHLAGRLYPRPFYIASLLCLIVLTSFIGEATFTIGILAAVAFFYGNMKILSRSVLFEVVESQYIGRVMTSISMVSLGLSILCSWLFGYLAQGNIDTAYLVLGAAVLLPAIAVVAEFFAHELVLYHKGV